MSDISHLTLAPLQAGHSRAIVPGNREPKYAQKPERITSESGWN